VNNVLTTSSHDERKSKNKKLEKSKHTDSKPRSLKKDISNTLVRVESLRETMDERFTQIQELEANLPARTCQAANQAGTESSD
jgi:hypothetical protein